MRLWLLSHLIDSPGNRLVLEAAGRAGVEMLHVDPRDLGFELGAGCPKILGGGMPPALVMTRTGSSAPAGTLDVVRALEGAGLECVNCAASLELSRDKLRTFSALSAADVPLPPTVVSGQRVDPVAVEQALGPPPWVIKLPVSTQGLGVAVVDSPASLRSVTDLLRDLGQRVILQALIAESFGTDIRVLVLGGQARYAMQRRAASPDEFRSNLHRGGVAEPVALTRELADVAQRAATALGVEVAGVDLLVGPRGPLVIEVNGSPGLRGMVRVCGEAVADDLLSFLLERARGGRL